MIDTEIKTQRVTICGINLAGNLFELNEEEMEMYEEYESKAIIIMKTLYRKGRTPVHDPIEDYLQLARIMLCECIKSYVPGAGSFRGFLESILKRGYYRHSTRMYTSVKMTNENKNLVSSIYEPVLDERYNKGSNNNERLIDTIQCKEISTEERVVDELNDDKSVIEIIFGVLQDIVDGKIYNLDRNFFGDKEPLVASLMLKGYNTYDIAEVYREKYNVQQESARKQVPRLMKKIRILMIRELHKNGLCLYLNENENMGVYKGDKMREFLREYLQ